MLERAHVHLISEAGLLGVLHSRLDPRAILRLKCHTPTIVLVSAEFHHRRVIAVGLVEKLNVNFIKQSAVWLPLSGSA